MPFTDVDVDNGNINNNNNAELFLFQFYYFKSRFFNFSFLKKINFYHVLIYVDLVSFSFIDVRHIFEGCLWVVPREFDPHYDQPESYEHSRPATPSSFEKGCYKVRFPIGAARPLTAQKGSAVMWYNFTCICLHFFKNMRQTKHLFFLFC